MKVLLDALLPRVLPGCREGEHFLCVPHEGKSDLLRSLPRKLAAWRIPGDRFVVVQDNDGADCKAAKARLMQLCSENGRPETLVRLVCQELEAWYLGDLETMAEVFGAPKLLTPAIRKRYGDPDAVRKPSEELKRWVPAFQKGAAARRMGEALREPQDSRSRSYQVFVAGVRRMALEMGWQAA